MKDSLYQYHLFRSDTLLLSDYSESLDKCFLSALPKVSYHLQFYPTVCLAIYDVTRSSLSRRINGDLLYLYGVATGDELIVQKLFDYKEIEKLI